MTLIAFHSFDQPAADQPTRAVYVNPAQVFAVEPFMDGGEELGTRIRSSHNHGEVRVLDDVATVVAVLRGAA